MFGQQEPIRHTRRLTRTHRQLLAALLVGVAALLTISLVRPAAPSTTPILVASRTLPAGHALTDGDLLSTPWPDSIGEPPATAELDQLRGRVTAGPVAAGEPVSLTRVVGPGLLELTGSASADPTGFVAAPVRLADAGQAALIRPGDIVDVIAARAIDGGGQSADLVASDVRVITIAAEAGGGSSLLSSSGDSTSASSEPGNLIVLAVTSAVATELAAAATRSRLSVVLKPSATPTTSGGGG